MSDWVVIEICCDGFEAEASRHDVVPIAGYRRLGDAWAPVYSSNSRPDQTLDNRRQWLDGDEQRSELDAFGSGLRATDTFPCPECEFTVARRWDDIEKLLDAALELGWSRVLLRQWAKLIR